MKKRRSEEKSPFESSVSLRTTFWCLDGHRSQGRDLVFSRTHNAEYRVGDSGEREKEKGREQVHVQQQICPKLHTTGMCILNACPLIRLSKRKPVVARVSLKQEFKS